MKNVFDVLKERGFIKQTIYEKELYDMLGSESVPFYIGFDPTADSLHIGHYIPIMAMAWMQKYGHKPIALFGGGTGMIGDPSGRSDMRQMMTRETIDHNIECFKEQMKRFIKFDGENAAIIANNADWLLDLNYVEFLREIGVHFSVNEMLTAKCFKQRMEKGLTFPIPKKGDIILIEKIYLKYNQLFQFQVYIEGNIIQENNEIKAEEIQNVFSFEQNHIFETLSAISISGFIPYTDESATNSVSSVTDSFVSRKKACGPLGISHNRFPFIAFIRFSSFSFPSLVPRTFSLI